MGFKQPIVPEYRSGDGTEAYIRRLILFLKDFCQEAWTKSRTQDRAIEALTYQMESMQAGGAEEDEAQQM